MITDLSGRSALVTGAAHGIGRAIAEGLTEDGARVVATDILGDGMAGLAVAATTPCDLTDAEAVRALVAAHGPFDILVHSAGGVRGQVGRPLEEITAADWHAVLDINMTAPFQLAQAVAPEMKARGHGRLVFISSGAGLGVSLTGIQAYAAAKAGEIGLTRQLAHELGPFGITVNSVAPGFLRSNPSSEAQWQSYGEDGQRAMLQRIARRRLGQPADIAHAVRFLVSAQADWITGQTLSVDGGK